MRGDLGRKDWYYRDDLEYYNLAGIANFATSIIFPSSLRNIEHTDDLLLMYPH